MKTLASEELRDAGPVVDVVIQGPRGSSHGKALIDTGASATTIDHAVAIRLGLRQSGTFQARGALDSEYREVPTYKTRLSFPGSTFPDVQVENVAATELSQLGVDMLLGRDVLSGTTLRYDGQQGSVSMSSDSTGLLSVETTTFPARTLVVALAFAAVAGGAVWLLRPGCKT